MGLSDGPCRYRRILIETRSGMRETGADVSRALLDVGAAVDVAAEDGRRRWFGRCYED